MPAPIRRLLVPALAAALGCALAVAPLPAAPAFADEGELWSLSGADAVAATNAISRFAFPDGASAAVLARRDQFPDALASGLLQDSGPLLLTETAGLNADTAAELDRLDVQHVTVLGGTSAVSEAVLDALRQAGYRVSRLSGTSRVDTAVAVASSRPASATVILARAFAQGEDTSQGFADALAAGAWSAASGFPVLLTETASLSTSTAAYLRAAAVRNVMIVGGATAVSSQVEQQLLAMGLGVRRLAGAERAATAVAIAGAQGWDTAGDVRDVVLVPARGDVGWAAGFAAASLAAAGDVAVLLAETDTLPSPTERFLSRGEAGLVCAPLLAAGRCDDAATELDLDAPEVGEHEGTGDSDLERDAGDERTYTAGVDGGGPVTVALAEATASAAGAPGWVLDDDGDGHADLLSEGATITVRTGAALPPAAQVTDVRPESGEVAFDVSSDTPATALRPVVFVDLDGDGGLDVDGDGTPLEPASVGGATVWTPDDADSGSHAEQVVTQTWPALGLAASADATFRWDTGDTFSYNSGLAAPVSLSKSSFEAMLSPGDTLAVNVADTRSRFTIVRDVPAAPGGLSATPTDTDGDELADVLRVRWSRPPNTDLAGAATYQVELSTRTASGAWSAWAAAGQAATPSTLQADLTTTDGEHRVRVLARNGTGDLSAGGRPALATVDRSGDDAPPQSVSATFTRGAAQATTNTLLDAGDQFTVTFNTAVELEPDAFVDLRDKDGTLMRLTRDGNAVFTVGADGLTLTVAVTGPPVKQSTSTGDEELDVDQLVVVQRAEGIGNDAGEWNLVASGWNSGKATRSRMIVAANTSLPAPIADAQLSADPSLDRITIAAGATGIETGDTFSVHDLDGTLLVSGTYNSTNGTSVTEKTFTEGQRLYVVYTDANGARLPSRTASLLVGSPRPTLTRAEGTGDTITLAWAEAVTLVGGASLVEVYDKDDRVRVARTQTVQQAGSDRVLVDLDAELTTGTQYTVHVGAGLVRDSGRNLNDLAAPKFTAAAATPTLTVATGPAHNSTVTTAAGTWTGTAVDTVGVITAIQRQVDGGGWSSTDVTASEPDDSLSWSLTLTLTEGTHTVEIRALDDNGATSAVATRTIVVNAAAPSMSGTVANIGASTITVTFSEAVTCPDTAAARAAWTFDDTNDDTNDGAATAVAQTSTTVCTLTFAGGPFVAQTAGTLTYGSPAAGSTVVDGAGTAMAANSTHAVTAV